MPVRKNRICLDKGGIQREGSTLLGQMFLFWLLESTVESKHGDEVEKWTWTVNQRSTQWKWINTTYGPKELWLISRKVGKNRLLTITNLHKMQ